ncbi:uncharacterized protein M6B38_391920 [Iris pallida]|uniref:Pre-rRNA-processing protein Ipi1 N-terminal domain-containing protein n=1 Tax=Iris pallida TaxID=29817 RepID=A0AAX6FZD5_IRIPA|nr:uncharacterized protein M6B38_391920 [Iris pallida]
MVRSKPGPSKKPKRGVDFQKFKRKIGRKLPPPKNFTDTQIKSKAIVLPEQSVASERAGLAVNKKGLTLRELLQQTSHHNAKMRKAALTGIKDLIQKHPSELKLHKVAIIEKLRERICDNDKVVRESLYQLLETEVFRCSKEDISGPVISLLMAYVFNAMTHMAVDIRLMAFKFFNLIVHCFSSSFILYAEKVLDNYIDILKNNQIYLQDKNKLKNVLDGLIHCLSSLTGKKGGSDPTFELNNVEKKRLHSFETAVQKDDAGFPFLAKKLDDLMPILVNCFKESASLIRVEPIIDVQSFDCCLKTLQCINLAFKVLTKKSHTPHESSGVLPFPLSNGHNLMRSTILMHLKNLWELFPIGKMHPSTEKEDEKYFTLNVRIVEIFLHLIEMLDDTKVPITKFLEFVESLLLWQVCTPGSFLVGNNFPSNKVLSEKHFGSVIPFIPRVVSQITGSWRTRLLDAFTRAFENCKVDSKLCMAYLSAIEEMLLPVKSEGVLSITSVYPEMSGYQIAWIRVLPKILLYLGYKQSSVSKFVLKLMLRIGQWSLQNSPIALEYDYLQWSLKEFYSTRGLAGEIQYGPFIKLPRDCQELAIFSLCYFSSLSADLLEALTCCCLCDDMEQIILLRIVEVLQSAYKAGHVQISDQIGFLITLIARFKVFPEKLSILEIDGKDSNRGTFVSLTTAACSFLSQMGDSSLVLKLLWKNLSNEMSLKPSLDNMYGLLRMVATLDTRTSKLSEESIRNLSNWLFVYLVGAASDIPEHGDATSDSDQICIFRYYMQPCLIMFRRSGTLLFYVLELLASIMENNLSSLSLLGEEYALDGFNRSRVVCSILIFMHNDAKLHKSLSQCEVAILHIMQNVLNLLDSSKSSITLEEKNVLQTAFDQLKLRACKLLHRNASDLEKL